MTNCKNCGAKMDEREEGKCDRCPYEQLCRELPLDMSCEDVRNYIEAEND